MDQNQPNPPDSGVRISILMGDDGQLGIDGIRFAPNQQSGLSESEITMLLARTIDRIAQARVQQEKAEQGPQVLMAKGVIRG